MSPALLLNASPLQPQCCQETAFGTLVLKGQRKNRSTDDTANTPDGSAANLLNLKQQQTPSMFICPEVLSLSVLCSQSDGSFIAMPIFSNINANNKKTNADADLGNKTHKDSISGQAKNGNTAFHALLRTVQSIRGLQRRLEQKLASTNETGGNFRRFTVAPHQHNTYHQHSKQQRQSLHPLEVFQRQSEMIFREFVVALQYHHYTTTITLLKNKKDLQRDKSNSLDDATRDENLGGGDLYYIKALCAALEDIEWQYPDQGNIVQELSDDLDRVTLQYTDSGGRSHQIWMQLSSSAGPESGNHEHGVAVLQCEAALPPAALENFPVPIRDPTSGSEISEPDKKKRKVMAMDNDPSPLDELFESEGLLSPDPEKDKVANGKMLVNCFQEFVHIVQSLQAFWNEMDDLTQHCIIVLEAKETSNLKRHSTSHCIIKLNESAQMLLNLDVHRPRDLPSSYEFIDIGDTVGGATRFASRFQGNLKSGRWSNNSPIRENLERCLEVSLPSLETADTEVANTKGSNCLGSELHVCPGQDGNGNECGICYTRELLPDDEDGGGGEPPEFPSITCEHQSCGRGYHRSCLQEWLESLSSSRVTFDIVVGQCPYCQQPLSAPLPRT